MKRICLFFVLFSATLAAQNELVLSLGGGSQSLDNQIDRTELTALGDLNHLLESKECRLLGVATEISLSERWSIFTSLGLRRLEFTNTNYYQLEQQASSLIDLGTGIKFKKNDKWSFFSVLQFSQNLYPDYEEVAINQVKASLLRLTSPSLRVGSSYRFWQWKKLELIGQFALALHAGASADQLKVRPAIGVGFSFESLYFLTANYLLKLRILAESFKQDIESNTYAGRVEQVQGGASLVFGIKY